MKTRRMFATLAATALTSGLLVVGAGAASAAHCTAPGDHARANAGPSHDEGEHFGWASCVEQSQKTGEAQDTGRPE